LNQHLKKKLWPDCHCLVEWQSYNSLLNNITQIPQREREREREAATSLFFDSPKNDLMIVAEKKNYRHHFCRGPKES